MLCFYPSWHEAVLVLRDDYGFVYDKLRLGLSCIHTIDISRHGYSTTGILCDFVHRLTYDPIALQAVTLGMQHSVLRRLDIGPRTVQPAFNPVQSLEIWTSVIVSLPVPFRAGYV
jgi:hypothetical protein